LNEKKKGKKATKRGKHSGLRAIKGVFVQKERNRKPESQDNVGDHEKRGPEGPSSTVVKGQARRERSAERAIRSSGGGKTQKKEQKRGGG